MVKIIDLSLPIDATTTSPPSQNKKVEVNYVHRTPGWWQASTVTLSSHTATHVDSPLHVIKEAPKIGEISLEKLCGDAVILDLTEKGPNSAITAENLKKFDRKIRRSDIVLLRTDWTDKKWGTSEYWYDSPYLTEDGAKYLITKQPKAIGFDFFEEYSARLKDFKPEDFVVHKIILGAGVIIIEHLTNLSKISKERIKLYVLPLKLMVTEAAPARAIAVEE
ncbi:MAG: cyclase family protein [Candidatus Bathyarchaeia archaeon]